MSLMYNFIFVMRRLLYAIVVIFFGRWRLMQCICLVFLTVPIAFYHIIFRPFKDWKMNLMMSINEMVLIANAVCFFIYLVPRNELWSDIVAWVLLALIFLDIVANIVFVFALKIVNFIILLINLQKKLKEKRKEKLQQKYKQE